MANGSRGARSTSREFDALSVTWISLVCLAALLTIGLSRAHIWRRLTGQFDVDEVDG